jgi:peptidase
MSAKTAFIALSTLLVFTISVNAQSIKELEAQKRKAQERLEATQKLLDDTKRSRKGTEKEIKLLSQSMKEINNLIFSINSEIDGLNRDIASLETEKIGLTQRLEIIKKEYATAISRNVILRKQFSPTLFVFSAKNFSQAIRRTRYLIEMSTYRKTQVLEIKKLTKEVIDKEQILNTYIAQKSQSLSEKEQQNKTLTQKRDQQNQLLKTYNQKEQEYNATIREEQQRQSNLNNLIRKKVAEENRKKAEVARKAAAEKKRKEQVAKNNTKNTTKTASSNKSKDAVITETEYKQYKEDQALTGNFSKNKGNLPMPVESGRIYRHFGRQTNPTTNAIENNSGIYIITPDGAEARAVFDGTVFEVMYEPGSGYIIWITHGSFSTVYAQLSLFYVKKGDKIKARQKIGKIAQKNNKSELNFYILNESASYENPENWLSH